MNAYAERQSISLRLPAARQVSRAGRQGEGGCWGGGSGKRDACRTGGAGAGRPRWLRTARSWISIAGLSPGSACSRRWRRCATSSLRFPLLEETVADRERVLGPDHPDTLNSRSNLAHACNTAGCLERSASYVEALPGGVWTP